MKQILQGKIVSLNQKTIKLMIESRNWHRLYPKSYLRTKHILVHTDDKEKYSVGDVIKVVNCKPVSKRKRFVVFKSKPKDKNIR